LRESGIGASWEHPGNRKSRPRRDRRLSRRKSSALEAPGAIFEDRPTSSTSENVLEGAKKQKHRMNTGYAGFPVFFLKAKERNRQHPCRVFAFASKTPREIEHTSEIASVCAASTTKKQIPGESFLLRVFAFHWDAMRSPPSGDSW
jgi:hypothetical protein